MSQVDDKEGNSEDGERGFRVIDRRGEADKPEIKAAPAPKPGTSAQAAGAKSGEPRRPAAGTQARAGVDFGQFALSLATSAALQLGLAPHPETNKPEQNLPLAKQTIDILAMLEEKTQGNLTEQETRLLQQLVSDLKLRYVEISQSKP